VFLRHALPLGFVYGAMMAYVCAAPFVVRDLLGITTQTLGLIFGGILSGFIIGIVLSRLLVKRLGPDRLLSIGAALVLAFAAVTAAALIVWGFDLRSVVVPQVLLTLGAGLIFPNAVAGAITPYGARAGLAAARSGFLQMATGAAFGMLAGVLHDGSPQPMLALQLTAAVAAFGLFKGLRAPAPAPVNAGSA
jgi:DHA1 family bicyclomycin/chloramphenicol resistance-like MFS transporter